MSNFIAVRETNESAQTKTVSNLAIAVSLQQEKIDLMFSASFCYVNGKLFALLLILLCYVNVWLQVIKLNLNKYV